MMKTSELRLDNLLQPKREYHNQFHGYSKVTQVYKEGFTVDYHYPGNWFEPIALTPEILEKCGFADAGFSLDVHWYYKLINLPSNGTNPTYELNLFSTEETGRYGINLEEQYFGHCTYLHQLQNVYFALTNEELYIDLSNAKSA